MSTKVPSWLFFGGVLASTLSIALKRNFPDTLGRLLPLHWACAVLSAFLFSLGLFLSLRGFFVNPSRRTFFVLSLCHLCSLLALLSVFFAVHVAFTKIYYLPDTIPNPLPNLVEKAHSAKTQQARATMAERAYEFCGVTLAYRRDDGCFTDYIPSPEDVEFRHQHERDSLRDTSSAKRSFKASFGSFPIFLLSPSQLFSPLFSLAGSGFFTERQVTEALSYAENA